MLNYYCPLLQRECRACGCSDTPFKNFDIEINTLTVLAARLDVEISELKCLISSAAQYAQNSDADVSDATDGNIELDALPHIQIASDLYLSVHFESVRWLDKQIY